MTNREMVAERAGSVPRAITRQRLLAGVPVTERRLRAADVETPVLEGGAGAPVVLLHGPAANAMHWAWVLDDLVRSYRVIAPDLPGHGESQVDGSLDAQRVVEWLDELIEQTCTTPPALVGHTLGGAIAARYASTHARRVRRLVLVDSLGLAPFAPAPDFGRALQTFLADPNERSHDELWEFCARDLDSMRQRIGDRWETFAAYNLECVRDPRVQAALGLLMEQFGEPALSPHDLSRIGAPTTLIWGRHDLATPLDVAQRTSRSMGWPLHVIDSAGDDPAIEAPEAFLDVLRRALAGEARRGGAS